MLPNAPIELSEGDAVVAGRVRVLQQLHQGSLEGLLPVFHYLGVLHCALVEEFQHVGTGPNHNWLASLDCLLRRVLQVDGEFLTCSEGLVGECGVSLHHFGMYEHLQVVL